MKILAIFILGVFCFACGAENPPSATVEPTPAPTIEVKARTFNDDIETVRYNNYTYLFVLRRRDGKAIDGEDGKFIRANSPGETNQRLVADEGKAVILGTNFRFYPGQWDALNSRFEFQDLSTDKYEKNENDVLPANQPPPKKQRK